jgi:hypothetical protein
VTSLFLSTSTHYPGIRLRNQLVPWNLHASMAGFLAFDSGFLLDHVVIDANGLID